MKKPIIIIGGGGHTKVIIDILKIYDTEIIGIVDPDVKLKEVLGIKVLGDDHMVLTYDPAQIFLVNGIGSVLSMERRKQAYMYFKQAGYNFQQVIHPSAVIAKDVQLSEGSQVMAGAIIQTCSSIGANSIINTRASVDHDCRIGQHVHIAPGATLSGQVSVQDETHVGVGSTIIQGIHINQQSTIGAGAVVIRDVRPNTTVLGVPAREV